MYFLCCQDTERIFIDITVHLDKSSVGLLIGLKFKNFHIKHHLFQ
jgi:hypothetical protein